MTIEQKLRKCKCRGCDKWIPKTENVIHMYGPNYTDIHICRNCVFEMIKLMIYES